MRRNLLVLFLAGVLLPGAVMSSVAADKGTWQASKGMLPELSTPVGYTDDGAPVYLARIMKGSVASLGWFTPSLGKAQILDGPRTAAAAAFDVWSGSGRWVTADASSLPADALSAGKGADGRQVLLARVSYQGWLVPAVFNWQEELAVADIAGTHMSFSTFEVLVPDWTSVKNAGSMPVFLAGKDSDGSDLAPLRAPKGKGLHPGKWSAGSRKGYIPYGGKEIELGQQGYEVFIGTGTWVRPQGKTLPFGAIQAGMDDDGSALYMIRAKQGGADALGKFSAARGEAYIPYGGLETKVTSFEVLCYDLSPNREESVALAPPAPPEPPQQTAEAQPAPPSYWQPFQGVPPIHSVAMGVTADGTILFLARAVKAGVTSIGFLDPRTKRATIYGPKQAAASDGFEIWAGGGQWAEVKANNIPPYALSAGLDAGKKPVPIARVQSGAWILPAFYSAAERSLVAYVAGKRTLFSGGEILVPDWADANDPGAIGQAFDAGTDSDGTPLGLFRFPQGKSLQPGKVRLGDGQGYISGGGKEMPVGGQGAQLFVGKGAWAKPVRALAPDGAIPAGWDDEGNPLFMIRAKVSGADVPGKYNEKRNEALVPYGGKELKVTSFEVLCYAPVGGGAAVALKTQPVVAPQQAPPPPPPPQGDSASTGDWKKGSLWGLAAAEMRPPNKPAPVKIAPVLGYWAVNGKLEESERQAQGLLTDVYTYSGQKDEELDLHVSSQTATPGLYLGSPSNTWVEVAPRTGEGDFPAGGGSSLKVVLPETGTYMLVVSNYGESAGPYSMWLQGRAQTFTGTLSAAAAFAPVEVTAKVSAFYTIEVTAETFDPTLVLLDKKSQAAHEVTLDLQARRAGTLVYLNEGQTLVVQVRPAQPKASPAPKGPFKVNVRLEGFGQ